MEGSREWLAGVWFSLEMITINIASSSFLREVNESPISKTHILIYFILVPNALALETLSHLAWRWVW